MIDKTIFTIANVYTSDKCPHQFIKIILQKFWKIKKGHIIICGDFNAPMDPIMDTTKKQRTPRIGLNNTFSQEDLYSLWRCLHATEKD